MVVIAAKIEHLHPILKLKYGFHILLYMRQDTQELIK